MAYGPLLFGHRPQHVIDAGHAADQPSAAANSAFRPRSRSASRKRSSSCFPAWSCCGLPTRAPRPVLGRSPGPDLHRPPQADACSKGTTTAGAKRCSIATTPRSTICRPRALARRFPARTGMTDGIRRRDRRASGTISTRSTRCLAEARRRSGRVIMEPVMGNAGVILPRDGYLQAVRETDARPRRAC